MKRILTALIFIVSALCFSEPFEGSVEMVQKFLESGTYIMFTSKDKKSTTFIRKENIAGITAYNNNLTVSCNSQVAALYDDLGIGINRKAISSVSYTYYLDQNDISSDSNGNIVIQQKQTTMHQYGAK